MRKFKCMKYFIVVFFLSLTSIALGQETVVTGPDWLSMITHYIELLSQAVLGIMVIASIVVRLIPGTKDDIALENWKAKVLKVISYLPTFGINPRTKKLEAALFDLSKEEKEG